jgi:hypothetical protein
MDIDASVGLEHMLPAEPAPALQSGSYARPSPGMTPAARGVEIGDPVVNSSLATLLEGTTGK